MATSNVLGDIQDAFTCVVCLLPLTEPKSLQCLHSFCFHCLEQIYMKDKTAGKITCPTCRTETPVNNGDLNTLPNDFRAKQVQDLLKRMQITNNETLDSNEGGATVLTTPLENTALFRRDSTQKQIKCEVCLKNGQIVDPSSFCFDCSRPMCRQCTDNHSKRTHFKGHVTCEVESKDLHDLKCTNHNEYIQAMCAECWVSVCKDCIVTTHNNHEISAPQMTSDDEDATVGLIKEYNSKLHQGLLSLNELEKQHNKNIKITTNTLIHQKAVLMRQIDDEEQQMRAKIQQVHKQFICDASTFRKQTQGKEKQLQVLQYKADKSLRPFSFSSKIILQNRNEVAKMISNAIPSEEMPKPKVQTISFVNNNRRGENVLGKINFGNKMTIDQPSVPVSRMSQLQRWQQKSSMSVVTGTCPECGSIVSKNMISVTICTCCGRYF